MFAAGPHLEEDCWSHVKLQGRLLPGQACVTRAGKLPCKKVIHAVGPRWSGGNANEENILAMAVDSSLTAADEASLKSIAMPSISTGIFGFPLHKATDIIVEAVKSYFVDTSSTTVREVFFIDSDPRAVASLENKLKSIQVDGPQERPENRRGRRVVEGQQRPRSPQNWEPTPNTSQRGIFRIIYCFCSPSIFCFILLGYLNHLIHTANVSHILALWRHVVKLSN